MTTATMTFPNEAAWDRALRVFVGGAMLIVGWSGAVAGLWGMVIKLFALFPLASGLIGWDPIYALFGFSTRKP